jgi:hypothetical protein
MSYYAGHDHHGRSLCGRYEVWFSANSDAGSGTACTPDGPAHFRPLAALYAYCDLHYICRRAGYPWKQGETWDRFWGLMGEPGRRVQPDEITARMMDWPKTRSGPTGPTGATRSWSCRPAPSTRTCRSATRTCRSTTRTF